MFIAEYDSPIFLLIGQSDVELSQLIGGECSFGEAVEPNRLVIVGGKFLPFVFRRITMLDGKVFHLESSITDQRGGNSTPHWMMIWRSKKLDAFNRPFLEMSDLAWFGIWFKFDHNRSIG